MATHKTVDNGNGTSTISATFVQPTGLKKDFTSMTFDIPDNAEAETVYNIGISVEYLDNNGSCVEDPVLIDGTITVQ